MLEPINLETVLDRTQLKFNERHQGVVSEVKTILQTDFALESQIAKRIASSPEQNQPKPEYAGLNRYHIDVIKSLAVSYRLRFLPSHLFKGEIPKEALFKTRMLESKVGSTFQEFFILAPAERFKLKDSMADPILFAKLSDGQYVKVHKWGTDMRPTRLWINLAIRTYKWALAFSALIGGLLSFGFFGSFVTNTIGVQHPVATVILQFQLGLVIGAGVFTCLLIVGLLNRKDFSEDVWRSQYFN